ncbi:pirin family protein [Oscillatoria sp. FACHB-1406]|uniref:pirin family protein n=1 Tax=Oscillatoria sp. FACHB-1406 TaxID=2692846 RepID=UPI0016899903|nr:pirin family protein [Oscillatoria sp. FACHB-1406]MBD2578326.1 pirin family protein [Oscillatoria sp. FACHB-1406]
MLSIRRASDRGHVHHSWLDARHTFSFANYYDPNYMGFRSLRVINEDRIDPGAGFGKHGHRDMEIITYVLEGTLEHQDSLGNRGTIRPGEVQYMSAGTGILHSEYNASSTDPVHLLQIWIVPDRDGLEPRYEQRDLQQDRNGSSLQLIAAKDGIEGAISLHQDAKLYAGTIPQKESFSYTLQPQRHAWIQVARGELSVNDTLLNAGDGAAISEQTRLVLEAKTEAEVILFDLA